MLQDLYNTFGYIVTEEQAVSGTSSADLDLLAFERFMTNSGIDLGDEPRLQLEDDLRNRGLLVDRDSSSLRSMATLYGLIAFGKNPQAHAQMRSFWIECVAYAGTDRADEVVQVAEARGRLDEQVDRALGWMKSMGRQERHVGARREDVPLVPEGALREVLVNAVCHRDYAITGSRILLEVFADRVVVTNPAPCQTTCDPSR